MLSSMKVIDVDRIDNEVVVTFEDGTTFLYAAELLYGIRQRAEAATFPPVEEPEDK